MPWSLFGCGSGVRLWEDDPPVSKPRLRATSLQKYKVCFYLEANDGTTYHSYQTFEEENDGRALVAARKWIAAKRKRDAAKYRDVSLHKLTKFVKKEAVVEKVEEVEITTPQQA